MAKNYINIKPTTYDEFDELWAIFQQVSHTGDTIVYGPNTSKDVFRKIWFDLNIRTYTAFCNGYIVGSYILQPNHPDLGSHIANASYIVAPKSQGHGVGRAMGEHSITQAKELGYLAMQFNMVVSTNQAALSLWQSLGFQLVGTVPKAFKHRTLGLVDGYVMYLGLG